MFGVGSMVGVVRKEGEGGLGAGLAGRPAPAQVCVQLFGGKKHGGGLVADEPEAAFTFGVGDAAGHSEDLFAVGAGMFDGVQASPCRVGLGYDERIAHAGDEPVAHGELVVLGAYFIWKRGEEAAMAAHFLG